MKNISELDVSRLKAAASDFRYLLARGYPRTAALALVGNRYGLDRTARQLLHRAVFAPEVALARRGKLRRLAEVTGLPLGIDGHNVLITVESALQGLPLVAADDGFIRDAAQISRTYRPSPDTDRALALLAEYLGKHDVCEVRVLYDAPLSKSGELARRTQELWAAKGIRVAAAAVPVPERELLSRPGPIATSDTHLIDARDLVVDLAGEIIRRARNWQVISLALIGGLAE